MPISQSGEARLVKNDESFCCYHFTWYLNFSVLNKSCALVSGYSWKHFFYQLSTWLFISLALCCQSDKNKSLREKNYLILRKRHKRRNEREISCALLFTLYVVLRRLLFFRVLVLTTLSFLKHSETWNSTKWHFYANFYAL